MRIIPWLVTALGCLAITGSLAAIKYRQIQAAIAMAAMFPPPTEVVASAVVEATDWTPIRRLTGTVRAPEFITIAAEAGGRITALPHAAGEPVQAGDLILQLFDQDLRSQRDALHADLKLAETQLERVRELMRDSLASQDQLDTLLARIQSLRAQISATDADISRLAVNAPFTGRLGIYAQAVGDIMQVGETLTTLTGAAPTRWIDFKVPQGLAEVSVGDSVRLLDIAGDPIGRAEVIAVADAYDSALRAYDVRARIENPRLRHGELLQVEVQTGRRQTTLVVPNRAVRWDVDGAHVFVLVSAPEGGHTPFVAERRQVTLMDEINGEALLVGDLKPGDAIASAGAFKLSDTSAVIVNNTVRGQ